MARKTKKSDETEAAVVPADEVLPRDPEADRPIPQGTERIPDAEVIETSASAGDDNESVEPAGDPDTSHTALFDAGDEAPSEADGNQADRVDKDDVGENDESETPIVSDAATEAAEEPQVEEADAAESGPMLAPVPPATVIERRGPGVIPLLIGGLVAGGIGWAIATYAPTGADDGDIDGRIDALEAQIAALDGRDVAVAAPDLSAVEGEIAAQAERVDALAARIEALEDRPDPASQAAGASTADLDGNPALDTLRADLDALRDQVAGLGDLPGTVDGLRTDLSERIVTLETRIGDVAAEAETAEERAARLARDTARNQLALALETGQSFADQLEILDDVPPELAASAETGVPTFVALAGDFPDLARDALRVSRSGESAGGLGSLAGRLLNARSVEPRDGDDPDAVLSRAEAALRLSDLETALAELEALPPEARDVLSGWIGRAETRRDAEMALQTYLQDE